MARTTKVGLDVNEKPFVAGMGRAAGAAEKLEDALDDVTGSAKDTAAATARAKDSTDDLGESARDAGKGINSLRDDAAKLDRQIDESTRSVRELARAIAATSDEAERAKLTEKLTVEQGNLRQRTSLRKLIDVESAAEAGEEAARSFTARFAARLGPLMASAPIGPAGAIAGGLLGAAAAPTIAAAVSGAVVGGAGVGGVVGGVLLAARDERVKAAGASLGTFILGDLETRAAGFVPPVLEGISDIRAGWQALGPDLDRIFESSRFVDPLVQGAISGGQKLVAGVADAVDKADPVIDALGRAFDQVGETAGDALSSMADDADEGAAAIDDLTLAVTRFVDASAKIVHAGAVVKGWSNEVDVAIDKGRYWIEDWMSSGGALEHFGIKLDLTADGFKAGSREAEAFRKATLGTAEASDFAILKTAGMTDAQIAAKDASGTYRQKLDEVNNALGNTPPKVEDAIGALRDWYAALDEMTGKNIDARQAQRDLEEAIDGASEAVKRNGETAINNGTALDINSAKGRANAEALDKIASEANDAYTAIMDQTGSQELANVAADRGRAKFIELAQKMGLSETAAIQLADSLIRIKDRKVTVTADTSPALNSARGIVARINNMHARIKVSAEPSGGYGGSAHTGDGYSTGMRWGGVVEHAQDGLLNLRQAGVYSPQGPARYAFAEPATGGEAFIPRFGDANRSLDILSRAAKWYGAAVVPGGGSGGGGMAAPEVRVFIGDQELRGMVRVEVSEHNRGLRRRVGAGAGR